MRRSRASKLWYDRGSTAEEPLSIRSWFGLNGSSPSSALDPAALVRKHTHDQPKLVIWILGNTTERK